MELNLSNELKKEIDNLLRYMLDNGFFSLTNPTPEMEYKAFKICKYLNLIRYRNEKKGESYELIEKGVLVINDGGINNYLSRINKETDLDNTIKVLTSKRLKYDIYYNSLLVIIGALIGILPTLMNGDKNLEVEIEKLKSKYEKTSLNDSFQTQLNHKNSLILSLKNEIDTLKIKIKNYEINRPNIKRVNR